MLDLYVSILTIKEEMRKINYRGIFFIEKNTEELLIYFIYSMM
jgi:hypothetical protein